MKNTNRSRRQILTAAILIVLGAAGTATAQTNTEIFQQFQWNFSTPGARANGMGRAFIGIADDASAAVVNPAGLMNLTRPQVYFEFKNTDLDIPRFAEFNAILTGSTTDFGKKVNAASFISFAMPIGTRLGVSFAVHEFLNYKEEFNYPPRLQTDSSTAGVGFFPVQANADFRGVSFAGSVAAAIGSRLRVGVTVASDRLSAEADLLRTGCAPVTCVGPGLTAATNTGIRINRATIAPQTSTSTSATVGILYRASEKLSAGVVFVKGPSFKVEEEFVGFDSAGNNPLPFTAGGFPRDLTINVPSRFGFGVSARPTSRLLVTIDVAHITYSSLDDDFVVTSGFTTFTPDNFTVKNGTEVHFGGEYNLKTGTNRVFVRAGVFTNPDHRLTFVQSSNLTAHTISSANDQFNLLGGKTKTFGTVGAGFTFGRRLQADVAYVGTKEFVVSIGGRF